MNHGSSASAIDAVLQPELHNASSENVTREDIAGAVIEQLPIPEDPRKLQLDSLKHFLGHLHIVLDTLAYLELSNMYYME